MIAYKHKYDLQLPYKLDQRALEHYCFLTGRSVDDGGLGRFGHWKRWASSIWPHAFTDDRWNPWLEDQLRSLMDDSIAVQDGEEVCRNISWTGCASAGKTYAAGMYAVSWWLAAPQTSTVIVTSTSKGMLRRRIWPVIQDFHQTGQEENGRRMRVGHIIDSQTKLLWRKGTDKHAIYALAVEEGQTQKTVGLMKGVHSRRMLLIVDEADSTPEAIFEVIPNLRKACQDLTILSIGNSVSQTDAHGLVCEPLDGWSSVGVEMESWPTKGVAKWNLPPGVCLHFDGEKSPNVRIGKTRWPYLYTFENHRQAVENPEYRRSLGYWQMDRGFWPPEGICNTVFSEAMINRFDGTGQFAFGTEARPAASLDPAFGGDHCVLQFALIGNLHADPAAAGQIPKIAIQLGAALKIYSDVTRPEEQDYQIARRVIEECKMRNIEPEMFGMDTTGSGRGIAAIIGQEWSPRIQRVEFGACPTERPSSTLDSRPCLEVYDRFVTELWFTVKEFLTAGQLKGLYREAIQEFCNREYTVKRGKTFLTEKIEVRRRIGRSPDHADAIAILTEVARRSGINPEGIMAARSRREFERQMDAANTVYEDALAFYE